MKLNIILKRNLYKTNILDLKKRKKERPPRQALRRDWRENKEQFTKNTCPQGAQSSVLGRKVLWWQMAEGLLRAVLAAHRDRLKWVFGLAALD